MERLCSLQARIAGTRQLRTSAGIGTELDLKISFNPETTRRWVLTELDGFC